jgi:hypothetical protein
MIIILSRRRDPAVIATQLAFADAGYAWLSPLLYAGFQELQHLMPRIGTGLGVGLRRAAVYSMPLKPSALKPMTCAVLGPNGQQNEMTCILVFQMPERKFKTVRFERAHRNVGKSR